MNLPVSKIATVLGILVTLGSFGAWVVTYHLNLATQEEVDNINLEIEKLVSRSESNVRNLDTTISTTELKVLIYTLYGVDKLDPVSKGRYELAVARLVNLEAQRDETMAPTND